MAMAEEQQQQRSGGGQLPMGLLKMVPGPIGQLADLKNNLKSMGKQAGKQVLKQLGKQALKKGEQLAANVLKEPHVLAAIGIILGIAIVIILFIIIITNILGQNNANGVNAQPGPPPTQGQVLTCLDGAYATCLKEDFNIIVSGARGNDLSRIFQSFAFAGQSKQYVSLLEKGGNPIRININYDEGGCGARAHGFQGVIDIHGGADCARTKITTLRHFLIHESGHIINARNRPLFYSFPWTNFRSSQSSDYYCFDLNDPNYPGEFLKTYPLSYSDRHTVSAKDESFAEAITDATTKLSYGLYYNISNFSSECPAIYSWIDLNIYGGYSFY
jgi:hypothetical protein